MLKSSLESDSLAAHTTTPAKTVADISPSRKPAHYYLSLPSQPIVLS
jgi:hypothetical protein